MGIRRGWASVGSAPDARRALHDRPRQNQETDWSGKLTHDEPCDPNGQGVDYLLNPPSCAISNWLPSHKDV